MINLDMFNMRLTLKIFGRPVKTSTHFSKFYLNPLEYGSRILLFIEPLLVINNVFPYLYQIFDEKCMKFA